MATVDDRHQEDSRQSDRDPMTTFTLEDMSYPRDAEPTALRNVADIERLRAAAAQALRILERTGLAPFTAALLRAALEPPEGQASQTHQALVSARATSLTGDARCPT